MNLKERKELLTASIFHIFVSLVLLFFVFRAVHLRDVFFLVILCVLNGVILEKVLEKNRNYNIILNFNGLDINYNILEALKNTRLRKNI